MKKIIFCIAVISAFGIVGFTTSPNLEKSKSSPNYGYNYGIWEKTGCAAIMGHGCINQVELKEVNNYNLLIIQSITQSSGWVIMTFDSAIMNAANAKEFATGKFVVDNNVDISDTVGKLFKIKAGDTLKKGRYDLTKKGNIYSVKIPTTK